MATPSSLGHWDWDWDKLASQCQLPSAARHTPHTRHFLQIRPSASNGLTDHPWRGNPCSTFIPLDTYLVASIETSRYTQIASLSLLSATASLPFYSISAHHQLWRRIAQQHSSCQSEDAAKIRLEHTNHRCLALYLIKMATRRPVAPASWLPRHQKPAI